MPLLVFHKSNMTSEFYLLKAEGTFEAMFFFDSAGFHGEVFTLVLVLFDHVSGLWLLLAHSFQVFVICTTCKRHCWVFGYGLLVSEGFYRTICM